MSPDETRAALSPTLLLIAGPSVAASLGYIHQDVRSGLTPHQCAVFTCTRPSKPTPHGRLWARNKQAPRPLFPQTLPLLQPATRSSTYKLVKGLPSAQVHGAGRCSSHLRPAARPSHNSIDFFAAPHFCVLFRPIRSPCPAALSFCQLNSPSCCGTSTAWPLRFRNHRPFSCMHARGRV
jgi:hypothetical protein